MQLWRCSCSTHARTTHDTHARQLELAACLCSCGCEGGWVVGGCVGGWWVFWVVVVGGLVGDARASPAWAHVGGGGRQPAGSGRGGAAARAARGRGGTRAGGTPCFMIQVHVYVPTLYALLEKEPQRASKRPHGRGARGPPSLQPPTEPAAAPQQRLPTHPK